MRVRDATLDDVAAIESVHELAVRELASEAYDEAVVEAWVDPEPEDGTGESEDTDELDDSDDEDEWAHRAQPDDGRRFVAEVREADDWTVAGFGDVRFHPPEYLTEPADGGVRAVYVHPDHARQGVGSALLERLEAEAREQGLDSLGLHASVNARPFYEAHGYEVVTELTFEFGGVVEGPAVEMLKGL